MHIFDGLEAEVSEKLKVFRQARKPLFAANDVRCPHQVVVNRVRKMVSRYPVRFKKHEILVVFGQFKRPLYQVGHFDFPFPVAVGEDIDGIRISRRKMFFDFFERDRPLFLLLFAPFLRRAVPIFFGVLGLLVRAFYPFKFFFRRENRISLAFRNEFFCKDVINIRASALPVRTVIAFVGELSVLSEDRSFVETDAVMFKRSDKPFRRASRVTDTFPYNYLL